MGKDVNVEEIEAQTLVEDEARVRLLMMIRTSEKQKWGLFKIKVSER